MRVIVWAGLCLLGFQVMADEPAEFIDEMARNHGFQREALEHLLGQMEYQPSIIESISRPAESLSWARYRPIFLKPGRIEEGQAFMREHREVLLRAERDYGVPAEIIAAIIGVETRYGQHKGRYRVLDALGTLAFGYPKRADFFRSELREFLLLTRDEKLDPLALTGSYAGAMGLPQFIPSSYRHYAVDFDGDGVRDLLGNIPDAIGSVANYLARHGWSEGREVAFQVPVPTDTTVLDQGLKPHLAAAELRRLGIEVPAAIGAGELTAPLVFEGESGLELWVTLQNFYAITRYNHSQLYALAVYQLAREIGRL